MNQPALSPAQTKFMEQLARTYLVKWAAWGVTHSDQKPLNSYFCPSRSLSMDEQACFEWVRANTKWVKKDGSDLTAGGYAVATSFLKR